MVEELPCLAMEFSVVDRVVFSADKGIGNSIGQQSRGTEGCLFRKELQVVVQGTEQARTYVSTSCVLMKLQLYVGQGLIHSKLN